MEDYEKTRGLKRPHHSIDPSDDIEDEVWDPKLRPASNHSASAAAAAAASAKGVNGSDNRNRPSFHFGPSLAPPLPTITPDELLRNYDARIRKEREEMQLEEKIEKELYTSIYGSQSKKLEHPHLAIVRRLHERASNDRRERLLRTRVAATLTVYLDRTTPTINAGKIRFEMVIGTIYRICSLDRDMFGDPITLDPIQLDMSDLVIQSIAHHIYGAKDWKSDKTRFLKERRLHSHIPCGIIFAPRQFGKSTCLSIILAAFIWHVPSMKVGVFAIGQVTSNAIIRNIKRYLSLLSGYSDRTRVERDNELTIIGSEYAHLPAHTSKNHPSITSVYAYSSTGGRGSSLDVAVVDEVAHIREDQFMSTIVPIVSKRNAALIGITTPRGDGNFCSRMFEMKNDDGSPMFPQLPIGLACQECRDAGASAECTHKMHMLPKWRPHEGQVRLKSLQGQDRYKEEMMAEINSSKERVFPVDRMIRDFIERRREICSCPVIMIFTDPSGGGDHKTSEESYMAAAWKTEDTITVIGSWNAFVGASTTTSSKKRLLEQVVKSIKTDPRYHNAFLIFCVEKNSGAVNVQLLAEWLPDFGCRLEYNCHIVHNVGDKQMGSGVWSSNSVLLNGIARLSDLLLNGLIGVANGLLTTSEETEKDCLLKLEMQMKQHVFKPTDMHASENNDSKRPGMTATGKDSGPDDRCKALYFLCWWMQSLPVRNTAVINHLRLKGNKFYT